MIPMLFSEVRVTSVADTPVLLLREAQGSRHLAIWITAAGGNAILSALEDADVEHPGTHDLMIDALAVLDAVVEAVHITEVAEGVFSAHVVVGGSHVTARVSDAVALALRCGATILADEDLLDAVGVRVIEAAAGEGGDEQMEEFRAFLDTINPEDFGPGPREP
ncbi:bifunctional nuclease family protein [Propioniciclava sinopodophylli]|uniref:Bifunctional nuclease family protein n=2 Tax=Propioniciclava sinopodophylli TaxID=1837344 RepID=A0A4Q9KEZ8_9ACTN|nr:bifunctional nuclease family protein [Propioniciclava sinopodophylli]